MLLVIVVAVWGTIGFKAWDGLNGNDSEQIVQNSTKPFIPKKVVIADTFSVQNITRDPFLGTIEKQKGSKPERMIVPPKIKWIPIVYNGILKNNVTGEHVYVLQINNKEHLLKRGNKIEGITLIKGNSKSIVVKYKGEQKTIKLYE